MTRPTLNIVGAGKAARSLARLWMEAQVFTIGAVCNRSLGSAQSAVDFVGSGKPVAELAAMPAADTWMIGTPDAVIDSVVRELHGLGIVGPGDAVFHLSGALPAAACGAITDHAASFHPVRSFAAPGLACRDFPGTLVAIEGDNETCRRLTAWARAIGAEPFPIAADSKRLYHAASAIAANYSLTLIDAATRAYRQAGIDVDVAGRLALSLAGGAVGNAETMGVAAALTGPIVRGDVDTVAAHLQVLPPELEAIYRTLGRSTVELARTAGRLDPATADALVRLLG